MISRFVQTAKSGQPLFITDVRRSFEQAGGPRIECLLVLPDGESVKRFGVPLPDPAALNPEQTRFVVSFMRAEIYNHLTTLGGYSLSLFYDRTPAKLESLVNQTVASFQVERNRKDRTGYARIVNVLDRMNDALHPDENADARRFSIEQHDLSQLPPQTEPVRFCADPTDTFREVTGSLAETIICGLDIGGTDIKAALAVNGALIALKEFDWNPATYPEVEMIVNPIVVIARLMRVRASLVLAEPESFSGQGALLASVIRALTSHATVDEMAAVAHECEDVLADTLRGFDAIGLCFPDVVVRNRIVGGEVPKTQGMRRNAERDFEEQFSRLTALDASLQKLCREGGVVMNTNDGPMAAFTAAVEIAASPTPELGANGVFAHTLGTDLGTGLALADGSIPEIPLEVYNLILDLGSDPARSLPAEDLRSLANTNTGIPGTPQRLSSQAGAFRLADSFLTGVRDDLVREIAARGYVVDEGSVRVVPESPVDQRKPYLAYLMERAESEAEVAEIFRIIGEYLAVVFDETEHILSTGLDQRFLFGRFVKIPLCFALMQEGAARRNPLVQFVAADSEMAYTPLMTALDADPNFTVAQFGQAIGAIYFGNMGLIHR